MSQAKRTLAAVATLALLLAGAPPLHAQTSDLEEIRAQIEAKREQIEETREETEDVREQLEDAEARRLDLAARVEELRAALDQARGRLAAVQAELDAAREHLREWTAELNAARAELDRRQEVLDERAAAAYRLGPTGLAQVVLGAQDLDELVDRVSYLDRALEVDAQALEDVRVARGVVAEHQDRVERYETRVAEREAVVIERVEEIAAMEAEQAALLADVDLEIEIQQETLDDLQAARERYEQAVAQLEAESARISGLIQGVGSVGSGELGGELAWPTAGQIVSGFGYRVHPVFGTSRFHAGVDIDGACGQPIFAGESGVVLSAGYNGGYGYATVVDHGEGVSTLYAHQSALGVSSGQSVGRGQQIGVVGTTGLSTGCHLHFEVRINGQPVDPVPYLT